MGVFTFLMITNSSYFDLINSLTTDAELIIDKRSLVNQFAYEFGWTPSYLLNTPDNIDLVSANLVVEHGLENTAVITFLKKSYRSLELTQRQNLLSLSYNNLVDWHIYVEKEKITYVYNRASPNNNIVQEDYIDVGHYEKLRSEAFEQIIGTKPSPNIPSLDDALINTISNWKRVISAELDNSVSNEELSGLFNTVIFIRALEDYKKRFSSFNKDDKVLNMAWKSISDSKIYSVETIFKQAFQTLGNIEIPDYLIDYTLLKKFDKVNKQSFSFLLNDFYENRHNSFFSYDFSIMSSHALSRIYEKYVALLKVENSSQLTFFPKLPSEQINKAYGAVYTPQYVARFFARYLKENLPPSEFKSLKIIDPAVGSGIFLRSLLEIQCDPRVEGITKEVISQNFASAAGVDIDVNACKATELSLALLQLLLTGKFPDRLNINNVEAIGYFKNHPELKESYDAVLANPPFIPYYSQSDEIKSILKDYLGDLKVGSPDIYLAFLKMGLDLLKPGGFGLYIVPQSFMLSSHASKMRREIYDKCNIKCIADLSSIPVFGDVGVYVNLLIFQKKRTDIPPESKTIVVKCQELVGKALFDAVNRDFKENTFYSVFEVSSDIFKKKEWHILPLGETKLMKRLSLFPTLDNFLEIRQGFVSGNDKAFIFDKNKIPKGEEEAFMSYLPDKEMDRYLVPDETKKAFLFPFKDGKKMERDEFILKFPETWKILKEFREENQSKKSFEKSEWWRPHRTRHPDKLQIGKIITPHLVLTPKFSIDFDGEYSVSHAPFFIPKKEELSTNDFLKFFCAVLNSSACFWYISNHSHVYRGGYTKLEVHTLKDTPVPDPSSVPPVTMKKIINLVTDRLHSDGYEAIKIERQIDELIADIYLLNSEERGLLGIDI